MSTPQVYGHEYDENAQELEVDFYFAGQNGGHVIRTYSDFSKNDHEEWRLDGYSELHFFHHIMDRPHTEERL